MGLVSNIYLLNDFIFSIMFINESRLNNKLVKILKTFLKLEKTGFLLWVKVYGKVNSEIRIPGSGASTI
jgi:hypothetical protein